MKRALAQAIKGMTVKTWEIRENSEGRRVVYVRYGGKTPRRPRKVGRGRRKSR